MSNKIHIKLQQTTAYSIRIGCSLLDVHSWLPKTAFSQIVLITDHKLKILYGLRLQQALQQAGFPCLLLSFPAGEKQKNRKTKEVIEMAMLEQHCDRDSLILALGGGVVGDLAGFVAATYLRGIPYIQLPSSLLAMVDSSVGGKTGINTSLGKNLIGAIYQPKAVVIDLKLLQSLPKKHRINGFIEAVKMFLTHDAESFFYSEAALAEILKANPAVLEEIVTRAVNIKAAVVHRDEKEQGERALLNFGHTIGHALEKISQYRLLHGYAVAYGILIEATIAELLGIFPSDELLILKRFFSKLGIHSKDLKQYDIEKLIAATHSDKKMRSGQVRYTLISAIGTAHVAGGNYLHPIDDRLVKKAFNYCIEG